MTTKTSTSDVFYSLRWYVFGLRVRYSIKRMAREQQRSEQQLRLQLAQDIKKHYMR